MNETGLTRVSIPAKEASIPHWLRTAVLPVVRLAMMLGLGFAWTRVQRVLGNDSFAYLAYTRQFIISSPDHLGDWWSFGFPFLGSLLCYLNISAHTSLLIISALSFLVILLGIWHTFTMIGPSVQSSSSPLKNCFNGEFQTFIARMSFDALSSQLSARKNSGSPLVKANG